MDCLVGSNTRSCAFTDSAEGSLTDSEIVDASDGDCAGRGWESSDGWF